jgi:radical SAM protein with 4Fe4S-binding SPASM domain
MKRKSSEVQLEVVHQNCKYNCRHCFIYTDDRASDEEAKQVAQTLTDQGYGVRVWASSMEADGAMELLSEFGAQLAPDGKPDCSVELRDSIPHFMENPPADSRFGFSLHGHNAELHDLLVRGRGNFDKVVESLREAKRRGLERYYVHHVVHKKNYKHLHEFCQLMEELSVPQFFITKMVGSPQAMKNVPEMLLEPEEIHEIVRLGNTLREQYRGRVVVTLSEAGFGKLFTKRRYSFLKAICSMMPMQMRHHCDAGHNMFAVSASTKDVYVCRFFLSAESCKVGHMNDDGTLELDRPNWKEDFRSNIQKIDEPCRSCGILKWCGGGCRATAMAEHNQLEGEWNAYAGLKSCPTAAGVYLEY